MNGTDITVPQTVKTAAELQTADRYESDMARGWLASELGGFTP
jgi:hypothetical protein